MNSLCHLPPTVPPSGLRCYTSINSSFPSQPLRLVRRERELEQSSNDSRHIDNGFNHAPRSQGRCVQLLQGGQGSRLTVSQRLALHPRSAQCFRSVSAISPLFAARAHRSFFSLEEHQHIGAIEEAVHPYPDFRRELDHAQPVDCDPDHGHCPAGEQSA
jgi:hypothetical protein